jgi:hypothetical protein
MILSSRAPSQFSDEVRDFWSRAFQLKIQHPLLNFPISFCESSMLASVLAPGIHDEGLDKAARVSRVAKQVPVESAVALFDFT